MLDKPHLFKVNKGMIVFKFKNVWYNIQKYYESIYFQSITLLKQRKYF